MTPSPKALKGSEQCQDDCTGEKFVRKRAVSQIDRKQWGTKRDLDLFYVNSVLQDQTALEYFGFSASHRNYFRNYDSLPYQKYPCVTRIPS